VIKVDETHWPLAVFTFGGQVTAEELEAYLKASERMLKRNEQYIGLVLTEKMSPLELPLMRRQAAWIKEHHAQLRDQSLGVALVIPSAMLRGVLKAILWLQPMPQPHSVTSTTEEALAWIRARLRTRNLELRSVPTL